MTPEQEQAREEYVTATCTPIDTEELWDDCLDEQGPVCIGSLEYSPSQVLKEVDPIAYRCGMSDFLFGDCFAEIDGEYYNADDVRQAEDDWDDEQAELEEEDEDKEEED